MTRRRSWNPAQWLIPALLGGTVFGWWLAQASALGSCLFSAASEPTSGGGLQLMEAPADTPGIRGALDPGSV